MATSIDTRLPIGDILDQQTQRYPDREALVHAAAGDRFTYREFHAEVERVARGLIAIGIEKGQHVGIWATNYTEWVLTQFATAKIGARPGQRQPRLPHPRAGLLAGAVPTHRPRPHRPLPHLGLRGDG